MNLELLEQARIRVPSVPVLVNLTSKRVRQLNSGMKPYVKPLSTEEDKLDIALREIAEGKIIAEVDFDAIARRQEALSKRTEDF
ncbi:MAG: DNA-directed RNA polymerase subunit omega [Kiritimatiellaeota bacterium]|nr:DNA-directed RNA polymerase subunit omega [Kiritimatiellota bacterium]